MIFRTDKLPKMPSQTNDTVKGKKIKNLSKTENEISPHSMTNLQTSIVNPPPNQDQNNKKKSPRSKSKCYMPLH